jgi:hypothetical protein
MIRRGMTHFPGMMDDPGSFSGNSNSPRPQRGPDPRYRISLAIFMNETAIVLRAPEASTIASWAARASNCLSALYRNRALVAYLVGGGDEFVSGDVGDFIGDLYVESGFGVETLFVSCDLNMDRVKGRGIKKVYSRYQQQYLPERASTNVPKYS